MVRQIFKLNEVIVPVIQDYGRKLSVTGDRIGAYQSIHGGKKQNGCFISELTLQHLRPFAWKFDQSRVQVRSAFKHAKSPQSSVE
jgi:hypothetical protein